MADRILKMMSGIGQPEMNAYFKKTPAPEMKWKTYFPVIQQLGDNWKTLSNKSYAANVASDPAALGSSAPIKSRQGTETIQGGFGVFKIGRIKDETEIQEFNELKAKSAQFTNKEQFKQITDWIGDDIKFVRNAALSQANYLNWALLTSACDLGYIASNSPQLASLKNITYPVVAYQKVAVSKSWADKTALIIDDIKTYLKAAKDKGKILTKLKINDEWFSHVQNNEQIQKFSATYVQNALNLQGVPSIESINSMLTTYFRTPVVFEVINELVSRELANGTQTSANPFANGVMVMTLETRVGSFQFKGLSSNPNIISTVEDFYTVERLYKSDPDLEKTLSKFKGMTAVDSYADNMYVKINAIAW